MAMDAEGRAIVVDLVHIEEVAVQEHPSQEQREVEERSQHHDRTEAASATRTASFVAPSPPDPDYFVG